MILGISLIFLQAMNPIFASAVVPGLGEMIQGEKSKARTFIILEGSLWISYLGFNYFGKKMDRSARAFAVDHSGANPANHDDRYYDAVEDYLSSEEHNLEVERNASLYYPDNPDLQQQYIEENGYFGEDAWEWDTITNRTAFWEKRKAARENLRRASFMPGFAIINRIVSIIDVVVFSEEDKIHFDTEPGRIGIKYRF
jgi:hypothetical protein